MEDGGSSMEEFQCVVCKDEFESKTGRPNYYVI